MSKESMIYTRAALDIYPDDVEAAKQFMIKACEREPEVMAVFVKDYVELAIDDCLEKAGVSIEKSIMDFPMIEGKKLKYCTISDLRKTQTSYDTKIRSMREIVLWLSNIILSLPDETQRVCDCLTIQDLVDLKPSSNIKNIGQNLKQKFGVK